jgi:hypothetical protein
VFVTFKKERNAKDFPCTKETIPNLLIYRTGVRILKAMSSDKRSKKNRFSSELLSILEYLYINAQKIAVSKYRY